MKTIEHMPIIEALTPGTTGAADRTGDYMSLKNCPNGVAVYVHMNQANAASAEISLLQATAVAGTGAKAVTALVPIWSNLDCAASDIMVKRDAAASYETDAGVKHKIVKLVVKPEDLDVSGGFDCLAVFIASSDVANIIGAFYQPLGRRYANESMIAD
ncbi:MAG TPA: hypothetical protein DCZ95_18255 [Verrucomicrobia bacterium]|nr:hypothetical protein [Verrucomicrobiota bacterium]